MNQTSENVAVWWDNYGRTDSSWNASSNRIESFYLKKKKYNNDLNKTIQNKIQLKRKNLSVARTTLGSQTATGWSPPCWHWQIAKPDAEKQANKNSESFGLFIFFSVSFFFVFFFIFFLLLTRPFDSLSFWGSNLICSSQKPFCCFFVWNHSN